MDLGTIFGIIGAVGTAISFGDAAYRYTSSYLQTRRERNSHTAFLLKKT
jgi:hypothetical protein